MRKSLRIFLPALLLLSLEAVAAESIGGTYAEAWRPYPPLILRSHLSRW